MKRKNLFLPSYLSIVAVCFILFSVAFEATSWYYDYEEQKRFNQQKADLIMKEFENQLQLMDCQIPPALTARLKSLEEEQRRCEHLHNVRQCVTWVSGAVLLIAVVIVAVIYTQRWITIKRNSDNMAVLMAEKR